MESKSILSIVVKDRRDYSAVYAEYYSMKVLAETDDKKHQFVIDLDDNGNFGMDELLDVVVNSCAHGGFYIEF